MDRRTPTRERAVDPPKPKADRRIAIYLLKTSRTRSHRRREGKGKKMPLLLPNRAL